jgi:hypothetical protein
MTPSGAVGGDERGGAETVVHAGVRPPPGAPGREARIIGLQVGAAKDAAAYRLPMQQQHAAVPDRRHLALEPGEVSIDVTAPLLGESPDPRLEGQLEPVDAENRRGDIHAPNSCASNSRLGSTNSCCAATS